MLEIILIILASLGADLIITKSWIFLKVREYFEKWEFSSVLFNCPQCMGFWCGIFMAILFSLSFKYTIAIAFTTSLLGSIYETIEEYINTKMLN